ncbi:hypothetical protein RHSIM_Rhsim07G0252000 [Rhododendron simsii]|uniref:Uncharacterized protein n=1 Tax=Rhododendron simsii TaxID=118357 RepID=A0A834LIK3_RHOSS|nr:hypothetical protein RHSIM_Rhsim07G0252000 [Rhododendron simsii]
MASPFACCCVKVFHVILNIVLLAFCGVLVYKLLPQSAPLSDNFYGNITVTGDITITRAPLYFTVSDLNEPACCLFVFGDLTLDADNYPLIGHPYGMDTNLTSVPRFTNGLPIANYLDKSFTIFPMATTTKKTLLFTPPLLALSPLPPPDFLCLALDSGDHLLRPPLETILLGGKVHGSLAHAGKVRGQTLKVAKQDKKKKPSGRAHKRMQCDRRFVTAKRLGSAGSHVLLMEKKNRLSNHISKHNYRCGLLKT